MNKYIKGLSLLALIGVLMSCAPFNSSTSNNDNSTDSTTESSDINTSNPSTSEDNDSTSSESSSEDLSTSEEDSSSSSSSETPAPEDNGDALNEFNLAKNIQDGTILHAWNWGLNEIKNNLSTIAAAGYSCIQTSPMQLQKDFYANGHWKGQWWKLYQPLSFSIATANHAIGNKNDLKELCKEADKYGIKIIVDVVANHLGGGNKYAFHGDVKKYEPEIYNNNLFHKDIGKVDDASTQLVVQGYMGDFPDLKTEDKRVQNAVLDLLKEYVDCGVDGFRFDAAKHIENPKDGEFASDFWPTILNGVEEYATSKGEEKPYSYGEILHTPGDTRSYAPYLEMMSVTDSDTSEHILSAAQGENIDEIAANDIYSQEITADHAVIWAESHDTFANDNKITTNIDESIINKGYAIASSRNDAASLYFARPDNNFKLGSMTQTINWKAKEVIASNKFHNAFINSKELASNDGTTYLNYKYYQDSFGLMIVETSNNKEVNFDTEGFFKDGTYVDSVSGNKFTCTDGVLKGTLDESGIATLYGEGHIDVPKAKLRIRVSDNGNKNYFKPLKLTIKLENADKGTYCINDGNEVSFKKSTTITLGELNKSETITLKVKAIRGDEILIKEFIYNFIDKSLMKDTCINIPEEYITNKKLAVWIWGKNPGRWITGELKDDSYTFEKSAGDEKFLLASFNKNDAIDWNSKPNQTKDFTLNQDMIYDCSLSAWKK